MVVINWPGANPKMLGVSHMTLGVKWPGANPKMLGVFHLMLGVNWPGPIQRRWASIT